jgi:predicted amidophosphoribosyltransferase
MNENLPIFYYKICCSCGRKTLTYPNGLCRDCVLWLTIQHVVMAYRHTSEFHHKALYIGKRKDI